MSMNLPSRVVLKFVFVFVRYIVFYLLWIKLRSKRKQINLLHSLHAKLEWEEKGNMLGIELGWNNNLFRKIVVNR